MGITNFEAFPPLSGKKLGRGRGGKGGGGTKKVFLKENYILFTQENEAKLICSSTKTKANSHLSKMAKK